MIDESIPCVCVCERIASPMWHAVCRKDIPEPGYHAAFFGCLGTLEAQLALRVLVRFGRRALFQLLDKMDSERRNPRFLGVNSETFEP